MLFRLRNLLALVALIVLAATLAACGGVPGNAVVKVDGSLITKKDFNHWLTIAAKSSQPPGSSAKVAIPMPPDFKDCVATKRKQQAKPVKGQPKQSDTAIKSQCKQEYEGLRDQVLSFLISAKWLQGEANDLGIKVSDKTIAADLDKQIKQSFPKKGDFAKYLKTSGFTRPDLLFRVKIDQLTNKIRTQATKGANKVTDAQVQQYYNKNKSRFAQPERRDLLVVLTKTLAKARQAKAAIAGGESFAKAAKRFSIDQASKGQGGKLLGVTKGQQEKAFDTAIFAARRGQLKGPIKTQFGYYVFKVSAVTPASQQTIAAARSTINQLVKSQASQKALDSFIKKFEKKWKARTDCRKGFVVQTCKNAPKAKTQAPPGGVPQTGAQQQAPPTGAPPTGAPPTGAPPTGAPPTGAPQQVPAQP